MAVNIGPKIGITGEKEYRKQINDLIAQQKTYNAEMRELESSFDDSTSAMEKNRKKGDLLEKSIKNQEKQIEELEKGLKASTDKYGENATQTLRWKQAVANAKTELNKMQAELKKLPKSITQVGTSMQNAGKKMQTVGSTLTKAVTAPLVGLGAASIASFYEVDEGLDIVTKKTGATGEALESLHASAKNIATTLPTSFSTAGEAVGEVNTRFGVTGQELEDLSAKFIKFADLNDTDVSSSIDNTQKVLAAFGLETKDAGTLLDAMNKTGQDTGISMDALQASMVKNASALQEMGMDAYSAASFLGQVETSGANTEQIMGGLSKALTNAAEDGKTLPEALGDFQAVMNSSATDQEKLNAAIDLFGKKAGPAIYNACKEGSLSFESLSRDASTYMGSVERTFEETQSAPDKMKIALNNLKTAGAEIGSTLLEIASPAISGIGDAAKAAADWFNTLSEDQQRTVSEIGVALAVGGPVLSAFGRITEGIGGIVTKAGELTAIPGLISAISSPAGIAALAIGGLAVAFNLMDKDAGYVNETLQSLVTDTSGVVKELDGATESLQGTLKESQRDIDTINAQADVADELVSELEKLESQSSLTAEQQGRMRTIVGQLNSMYPDLSLQIDQSTGKLNKSTKEIKNYVENARKMSLLEAYTKASKKGYEDLAEASIALGKAQTQEAKNLEVINGLEAEKEALDNALFDSTGNVVDAAGNFLMTYGDYEEKLTAVSGDIQVAKERQDQLTAATEDAQTVYDEAETVISDYETAANSLTEAMSETASATENETAATQASTAAAAQNSQAVKERVAAIMGAVASAVSDLGKESTAWNDLYEATRESIESQIGLFDEWKQDTEVTAQSILKNLQSQTKGMSSYTANMKRLSAEAVKSSDPNFKALVQALNEMGVSGAAEAQALVDALDNDKELFNQILSEYGEGNHIKDDLAETATYIESDFKTRTDAAMTDVLTTIGKLGTTPAFQQMKSNATKAFEDTMAKGGLMVDWSKLTANGIAESLEKGYTGMPETAKASAQKASAESKAIVDGTDYDPKIKDIDVTAKATADAESDIEKKVEPSITIKDITATSPTLAAAWSNLQSWFNRNPVTAHIKQIIQKATAAHNANGGFIESETLSWLAEGNQPEVVIPLTQSKRNRALSLYEETGRILGADTMVEQSSIITFPGGAKTVTNEQLNIGFDAEQLYATVASAAAHGMENANVKIYWDNREAGRVMRDMGVVFT